MRILITGCQGQLGHDCMALLGSQHEVCGLDLPEFDITQPDQITEQFGRVEPDVVINCGAFTRVDECETKRDLAFAVNSTAVGLLAQAVKKCGARLIHISTDYVFDGEKPVPQAYVESDPVRPLSVYGVSKLAGEQALVAQGGDNWVILRTAWLYGQHGRNFPKAILRAALTLPERPLRVINEQYGSPTWSFRLALQIERLLASEVTGICHAAAEGYGTWFDFAEELLRRMQITHVNVRPCHMEDFPLPARRPRNSILENARLKAAGRNVFRDWRIDLADFVHQHRDGLLTEVSNAATA